MSGVPEMEFIEIDARDRIIAQLSVENEELKTELAKLAQKFHSSRDALDEVRKQMSNHITFSDVYGYRHSR